MFYQNLINKLSLFSNCPQYEAKYIMEEIIGFGCDDESQITQPQKKQIDEIIEQRKNGIPLDRIFQKREFFFHEFGLNDATLSPRSDSEILIESVLQNCKDVKNIVDIGTGSGCLLLSLLDLYPSSRGVGLDISDLALSQAQINAEKIGIISVKFQQINILKESFNFEDYDLIISNPPYIPSNDIAKLDDNVKNFDPIIALDGGADGLNFYHRFYELLKDTVGKKIFFEIGINQENDVIKIFQNFNHKIFRDYNQINRIIYFWN